MGIQEKIVEKLLSFPKPQTSSIFSRNKHLDLREQYSVITDTNALQTILIIISVLLRSCKYKILSKLRIMSLDKVK